ncbi:MAG: hypothetical protein QME57_04745 [Patescibacteria group bacterium]|nr:hypothetical protein [Patescibacteria group bacterium]
MAEQTTQERKVLVAYVAQKIEEIIRDLGRRHGDILKSMGVNLRDAQVLMLNIIGEACETLKTKTQQQQEKKN